MLKRMLFYNFRIIFKFDQWVRRHISLPGLLVLSGVLSAAVFGIDTHQTLAYQLFSLMLMYLLVAFASNYIKRIGFHGKRILPRFARLGETLTYQIEIKNQQDTTQIDLFIQDYLHVHLPTYQDFQRSKQRSYGQLNWFDQYVGYPQWSQLVYMQRGGEIPPSKLANLEADSKIRVNIKLTPIRRGMLYFKHMSLLCPDPLGLLYSVHDYETHDSLLVLPPHFKIPELGLQQGRRYQPGGVSQAMSVGDSTEFMSLRAYRPGDPWQHIHWKSWARQGKPIVKEFQDEFFVRSALLLDTFIENTPEDQFEVAVALAISLLDRLSQQDSLLDLMFVGDQAHVFTGGRSTTSMDAILEILACIHPCVDKSFDHLLPLLTSHAHLLSACVCVLLDWDQVRQDLVEQINAWKIPLRVFIIGAADADRQVLDLPANCYLLRVGHIEQDLQLVTC